MSAKAKTRALTPKQEVFVAEYVRNGGNAKQAAIKAYPNQNENSAAQQGWQNLQKLELAQAIREEFSRQGITLEKALRPIVKGLEAKTKEGEDDLNKQLMAHDRWLKASTIDKNDTGLQLNIENAKGIEITFKDFRSDHATEPGPGTSGSTTQDA